MSSNVEKKLLFVINGLFVIISLFITFFGIWILCDDKSLEKVHLENFKDYRGFFGTLCIGVGIISTAVYFLGILAASRGSRILLRVYAGILITSALITFFHTMTSLSSLDVNSATNFEVLFKNDTRNEQVLVQMNSLQEMFKCCGYKGPEDVHSPAGYPWSCCGVENQTCTVPAYTEGCLKKVKRILTNTVVGSLIVKVIGILLQVVCIFAALRLSSKVVKEMATPVYLKM